jgi:hypothetical protein
MSGKSLISRGDGMQKFSSAAFIVGGIFVIVFNILTPRPADPADMQVGLTNMVENFTMFQLGHLMLAFGLWSVMVGAVGIKQTVKGRGEAFAQGGFYGLVLATTLWSITYAMTSVEAHQSMQWSLASGIEREVLYNMTVTTVHVGTAAYIMSGLFYWLALLFLGVGMALSKVYPGWLGWSAAAISLAMVVLVGVPQFLSGEVVTSSMIAFASLAGLTSIWMFITGIWIARQAW